MLLHAWGGHAGGEALKVMGAPADSNNVYDLEAGYATALTDRVAKAGMKKPDRQLLRAHVEPGDRSMVVHSRDALAGPLVKLNNVLALVASGGAERPGSTRSCNRLGPAGP